MYYLVAIIPLPHDCIVWFILSKHITNNYHASNIIIFYAMFFVLYKKLPPNEYRTPINPDQNRDRLIDDFRFFCFFYYFVNQPSFSLLNYFVNQRSLFDIRYSNLSPLFIEMFLSFPELAEWVKSFCRGFAWCAVLM